MSAAILLRKPRFNYASLDLFFLVMLESHFNSYRSAWHAGSLGRRMEKIPNYIDGECSIDPDGKPVIVLCRDKKPQRFYLLDGARMWIQANPHNFVNLVKWSPEREKWEDQTLIGLGS
jgi:hypothetical protein